jgi:glycerol-1-phosphate dehydrogenase [NAD(P)+]
MFPRQTIIDIDLLKCFPLSKNALGFGEFVGLYCSLLDYCEVRAIPLSDSPLAFIVELFKESVQAYRANSDTWLEITAICLIFKCLIMRENGDHQIGCGIDHMIAGVLKEVLQVPHGIAVYWGTIFALVLFPEWECFGLDLHTLLTVGTDLNLISSHEVQRVLSLEPFSLITAAMRLRPERPTVLQTVLTERWRFVSVYEFYNSLKISSFGKDN